MVVATPQRGFAQRNQNTTFSHPDPDFSQDRLGFYHDEPALFNPSTCRQTPDIKLQAIPCIQKPSSQKEAAHGRPLLEYYFLKPNMFRFFFFSFSSLLLSELGLGE